MPRRVAITIAGAVSLGAYEAGVMYELLEAFRKHNDDCDKNNRPEDKIFIDILTGASAGGMTAAILGQRLLFDGSSLEDPLENPLYGAWVKRIDIRELVELTPRELGLEWNSLLSSDLIEKIGREFLVDSMSSGAPSSPPHNTVQCDSAGQPLPLDVGLAITNLDGINYRLRIIGNDDQGFNYTRSDDQRLFHFRATDLRNGPLWERVRGTAVACGAFPVAFRPRGLKRSRKAYEPILPCPPGVAEPGKTYVTWPGSDETYTFVYTDGGVLQNQPLGIAKNFVDDRVRIARENGDSDAHCIADDRLYVLVSPNAVKSKARNGLMVNKLTIVRMVIELFHTYLRQATFHDWIVAEGMNANIHQFDHKVAELADHLAASPAPPPDLESSARISHVLQPDVKQRKAAVARLSDQYKDEYQRVERRHGLSTANSFIETVLALETAAGLGDRDLMKIVAVIADGRTELAGSGIAAFVGFFEEDFRKHDYWMGRVKTRVYLQRKDVKRILRVEKWTDEGEWGGPNEDGVRAKLHNPTDIETLPLPFKQQIRPGLRSLLHIIWIRPALLVAVVILMTLVIIALIFLGCMTVHCAIWLLHKLF